MQTVHAFVNDRHVSWDLPDPDDEIMLGIRWGHSYEVASPAFWLTLPISSNSNRSLEDTDHGSSS